MNLPGIRGQYRGNVIRLLLDFGEIFRLAALAIHENYDSSTTSASAEGIM